MKPYHLSASSISTFKACPYRYYMKYVLKIVPDIDADTLRYGTNWHRLLEILGMKPGGVCPECANKGQKNPDCPLCEGSDLLPDDLMDAVIRKLNRVYAERPMNKTVAEWETERIILLYSVVGYKWYYTSQQHKVLKTELKFNLPLKNPLTNRTLQNVRVVGKIDKIVENETVQGLVKEHKTTSSSLDSDSTYWGHLALDTQTRLYLLAARTEGYDVTGILYDVFHKPQIRPKKLTQGESKKFVENGKYMGEMFEVIVSEDGIGIYVNNKSTVVEPGKKVDTFAIRETPEMFGARLLKDISERPEFYFCCKPIPITEQDVEKFKIELCNYHRSIRNMNKDNCWFKNEHQCEATFKCPYINFCYNNVEPDVKKLPEGFKIQEKKDERTTSQENKTSN